MKYQAVMKRRVRNLQPGMAGDVYLDEDTGAFVFEFGTIREIVTVDDFVPTRGRPRPPEPSTELVDALMLGAAIAGVLIALLGL